MFHHRPTIRRVDSILRLVAWSLIGLTTLAALAGCPCWPIVITKGGTGTGIG